MKKALTQKTVITIIILLISFGVLLIITNKLILLIDTFSKGGLCGVSVLLSSLKIEKLCIDINPKFKLDCPTRIIMVNEEKNESLILNEKKPIKYFFKIKDKSKNYIEKVLINELYQGWETFGKGERVYFGTYENKISTGKDIKICHVYSRIYVANNAKKNETIKHALNNIIINEEYNNFINYFNNQKTLHEKEYDTNNKIDYNKILNNIVFKKSIKKYEYSGTITKQPFKIKKYVNTEEKKYYSEPITKGVYNIIIVRKRIDYFCNDNEKHSDAETTLYPLIIKEENLEKNCDYII